MKSTTNHKQARRKHHNMSAPHRSHAAHQADPAQNISPWVKHLTTTAVEPQTLHHHLSGAGETLRSQTMQRLQQQNGNLYIQREAISTIQRDDDDLMIPDINTASGPAAPIPVPYPNTSDLASPSQTSNSVKVTNQSAFTQKSKVGQSNADEQGNLKGMVSNTNMDKMKFKKYSSKIKQIGSGAVAIPPSEETLISRAVDERASAVGKQGGPLSDKLSQRINRNLGNGSPLSSSKQSQMESKFGTQFSDVRLHTNKESDSLSHQLNARAFTIGKDIFFNHSANTQDDNLLSHELTHVVQQQHMSSTGPMTVGPADDDMEKQAGKNASNSGANAYALPFEEQRKQEIHRTMINQGNRSGIGLSRMLGI